MYELWFPNRSLLEPPCCPFAFTPFAVHKTTFFSFCCIDFYRKWFYTSVHNIIYNLQLSLLLCRNKRMCLLLFINLFLNKNKFVWTKFHLCFTQLVFTTHCILFYWYYFFILKRFFVDLFILINFYFFQIGALNAFY